MTDIQHQQLEATLGYYVPSFFRIKLEVSNSDIGHPHNMTVGAYSVFFHEYIHYLQDVTTKYGLMNLSTISFYIREVAAIIGKKQVDSFNVPQCISQRDIVGYKNWKLKHIYYGNGKDVKANYRNFERYNVDSVDVSGDVVECVTISYKTDKDETLSFKFGGYHVCESMAALCQEYAYRPAFAKEGFQYISLDEYPYAICTRLAEYIYPAFAKESLLIIGLCDLSLLTYNAGLTFVRLLEYLKQNDFLGKAYNDTLDKIDFLYQVGMDFINWTKGDFAKVQSVVREEIGSYFKCEEFSGNNEWFEIVMNNAMKLRSEIPHYIVDLLLFKDGDVRVNDLFCRIISLMGLPLTINDSNEGFYIPPLGFTGLRKFHPALYWAIDVVKNIFCGHSDVVSCPIREYCKWSCHAQNIDDFTDMRCRENPWMRCVDEEDLCPFAIIWKHWNLRGHYPVVNR